MAFRVLKIAALFTLSLTWQLIAQPQLLRRSNDSPVIQLDPRGPRPTYYNTPLPYQTAEALNPCVRDDATYADYYYWQHESGWVLDHRVIREKDASGKVIHETILEKTLAEPISSIEYLYDASSRLIEVRKMDCPKHISLSLTTIRTLQYDDQTSIILKDCTMVQEGNQWKVQVVRKTNLEKSEDGRLCSSQCTTIDLNGESEPMLSRYEYSQGRISTITQFSMNRFSNQWTPAFRFDLFTYSNTSSTEIVGYRSSYRKNEHWEAFRNDTSFFIGTNQHIYMGTLPGNGTLAAIHKNEIRLDEQGNIFQITQAGGHQGVDELQDISSMRFDITYVSGSNQPQQVIGMYMDSTGIFRNSVLVKYDAGDNHQNNLLTLYPNPANKSIHVNDELLRASSSLLEVFNTPGNLVMEMKIPLQTDGHITVETGMLSPGSYTLQLTGIATIHRTPLVIVR